MNRGLYWEIDTLRIKKDGYFDPPYRQTCEEKEFKCREKKDTDNVPEGYEILECPKNGICTNNGDKNAVGYICECSGYPKKHTGYTYADDAMNAVIYYFKSNDWNLSAYTGSKESVLGQGGEGIVVKGTFGGKNVAIKFSRNTHDKEKDAMGRVSIDPICHENILCMITSFADKIDDIDVNCIVTEMIDGYVISKLPDELKTEEENNIFLRDMFTALNAIHREGIIHRDIKPPNIMRKNDGGYKLIDFGTMCELNNEKKCKYEETSNRYVPLEIHEKKDEIYDTYSRDIYALLLTSLYVFEKNLNEILTTYTREDTDIIYNYIKNMIDEENGLYNFYNKAYKEYIPDESVKTQLEEILNTFYNNSGEVFNDNAKSDDEKREYAYKYIQNIINTDQQLIIKYIIRTQSIKYKDILKIVEKSQYQKNTWGEKIGNNIEKFWENTDFPKYDEYIQGFGGVTNEYGRYKSNITVTGGGNYEYKYKKYKKKYMNKKNILHIK